MSTPPGYNPYGRGTLKLTPDVFRAGNASHARRWIQARARKLLSALSGGRSGGGVPSTETLRFIGMCAIWYTTSALSSNTGKVILNRFRYPVTLTIVQFAFVSVCSLLCMAPPFSLTRLRMPTRAILRTTLPMGMFQVGGHIFSSLAIARIPVSTVHTIKALSPLFTVAAYVLLFGVSYSGKTYFSLFPLTLGVMLACSFDVSASNVSGLLCAFGSALVFVTSNIFFKKVMPSTDKGTAATTASAAHKLDKLNLLLYSSGTAFALMVPIWAWTDARALWAGADAPAAHPSHGGHGHASSLVWAFAANGAVHFAQNAIAFVILARTSPVTYSIASLVKRVVVICMAVVWFAQRVHPVQALGIALTSVGLWLYNGAKADVAAGERRVRRVERARDLALPSTNAELAAEHMDGAMPAYAAPPTSPSTVRGRRGTLAPLATDGTHLRGAAAPLSIRITPPSAHPANAKGYPSPPDSPEHPETRSTAVEAR